MATVARQNGFAGPVELSIDGDEALGGRATLPAGQTIGFVPLLVKDGTKAGARSFRVSGTATIDGKKVARFGTLTDPVSGSAACRTRPWAAQSPLDRCRRKAGTGGETAAEPDRIQRGSPEDPGRGHAPSTGATARSRSLRSSLRRCRAPEAKPLTKDMNKGEIGVTVAAGAAAGPATLMFLAHH